MRYPLFSPVTAVTLGVLLMVLAGCASSPPSRFYILSPLPSFGAERQELANERCLAIAIGPVELSAYLDRPQIVTRLSPNELKLAEFDKWAEPLKDNFSRVLAENLSALLCVDAIVEFPRRGQTPIDYRVEVDVILLDGNLGGNASLVARWTVYAEDKGKVLLTRKSGFSEAIGAQDYEALVSAQSRMIAALSQEIGDAIRASMSRSIR